MRPFTISFAFRLLPDFPQTNQACILEPYYFFGASEAQMTGVYTV